MSRLAKRSSASAYLLVIALLLSGCGKAKENKPADTAQARAEARRHKDACASSTAYDRMKRVIFDRARQRSGHRANLDTLEAFSFVRMEEPVVEGWDPALDITRCKGHFILDVPPGSEQALGGERRLTADIAYTAQGAADASGLVYVVAGAEPVVSKLAAFDLADATYRPLPAVDPNSLQTQLARADQLPIEVSPPVRSFQTGRSDLELPAAKDVTTSAHSSSRSVPDGRTVPNSPSPDASAASTGEDTVRTFYNALGAGRGEVASAQVIPEKRSSRAYSADAISRFYGRLPDPLRLTSIRPLQGGAYRVTYRYAAPGMRCAGSAIVRLTSGVSRPLIRSITAGNGC